MEDGHVIEFYDFGDAEFGVRETKDADSAEPLVLSEASDGSAMLELRLSDRRLGFNHEPDREESGWHFVSTHSSGGVQAFGVLSPAVETEAILGLALPRRSKR